MNVKSIAICMACVISGSFAAAFDDEAQQVAERIVQKHAKAWNSKDSAGLAELFAADADRIASTGEKTVGADDIRKTTNGF